LLVITTVGTSLLEHCQEERNDLSLLLPYLRQAPAREWESHIRRIQKAKEILLSWATPKAETSAEIKSLYRIQEELGEPIRARLLVTDTVLSRLAAEVLVEVLGGHLSVVFEPQRDVIPGLQVWDRKEFERTGLVNLLRRIEEMRQEAAGVGGVSINITGGYKAPIPYVTIMAQVFGVPIYYIFEDTNELIRLPQVPVDIKWDLFAKYSDVLAELALGVYDWEQYRRVRPLEEDFQACIWEEEGMAELNALGRLFWNRFLKFFLVTVPRGSAYETESSGNKREINEALRELYGRLESLVRENQLRTTAELENFIRGLGDQNDLRHGENPDRDKFVFKSTRKSQVRLVYTPELTPTGLSIKLFDYIRGNFNHDRYLADFKQRQKQLAEREFVYVPVEKP